MGRYLRIEDVFITTCKNCGSNNVDLYVEECRDCGSSVAAECNDCDSKFSYHNFVYIKDECLDTEQKIQNMNWPFHPLKEE